MRCILGELFELGIRGRLFWDERAGTLEEQALEPFQDPAEMGMTPEQVVSKPTPRSYLIT